MGVPTAAGATAGAATAGEAVVPPVRGRPKKKKPTVGLRCLTSDELLTVDPTEGSDTEGEAVLDEHGNVDMVSKGEGEGKILDWSLEEWAFPGVYRRGGRCDFRCGVNLMG
jgi:hypothetical protein